MPSSESLNSRLVRDSVMNGQGQEEELPISDIEVQTDDLRKRPDIAAKFTRLIEQGLKPKEAALHVNSSIKGLMSNDEIKKRLQTLLTTANLPPEIRKTLVRNWSNYFLTKNFDSPDPAIQKLNLDVANFIGNDPTVGLSAPPQVGINIDLGNLSGVFEKLGPEWTLEPEPPEDPTP